MFFVGLNDGTWVPCGPKQRGAVQTTMQDLAARGLAAKVIILICVAIKFVPACTSIYLSLLNNVTNQVLCRLIRQPCLRI